MLPVYFAPVANANHENYQAPMLDVIYDAVITNPNSVSILANELFHAGWEWVVGKLVNCNLNALLDSKREFTERLPGRGHELDGVTHR